MSSRSFFQIVFKLFALLLLLSSVQSIFQGIQTLYFADFELTTVILSIIIVFALLGFTYVLLFKGDYIINKFKLTSNIEEHLSFSLHRSDILTLAIIIIGGYTLVEEIPALCNTLYIYNMQGHAQYGYSNVDTNYIVLHGVKILIALILLGNTQLIVNYIELKRKKKRNA